MREAVDALGGAKTPADIMAELDMEDRLQLAKLYVQKDKIKNEQSHLRKQIFEQYTEGKTIKELRAGIEKRRSDELAKQQVWELEKTRENKMRTQLASCSIRAPIDGTITYRYTNGPLGSGASWVTEGSTVHEREALFAVSSGPLVVKVELPEPLRERIAVGNSVRIKPAP